SLIEILIAIGLAAVLLPAILTGLVTSRQGKAQEGQRLGAVALLKEAEEAVRVARETSWSGFATNGTFHPAISGNTWTLAPSSEPINGYFRQIVISGVQRNVGGGAI